jgi:alkylation response protein AidB-like acyl-CoA dehydrogenase
MSINKDLPYPITFFSGKRYFSNGYAAHIAVLFARTRKENGTTAFIIEKGTPALED